MSDDFLTAFLKRTFGFDQFRDGQRAIVEAVLGRRDVLAVLPTGAGKSLCYQLPAAALPGLVVVASPLIALMKDQVDALVRRGMAAVCVHAGQSAAEQDASLRRATEGGARLLYASAERLEQDDLRGRLRRGRVALLAVDEAHCISEWGHDFRPAFRRLGETARQLAPRSVLALTATATPRVREDIAQVLGLRSPFRHVGGFLRPNLRLSVRPSPERQRLDDMWEVVRSTSGTVLVYVASRQASEQVAEWLRQRGERAQSYHAGMESTLRARVQDAFLDGRVRVVVATNAFGMGVDKPDVRAVVHFHMPASMESYYQEIGRGGRDGNPSRCVLLWSAADVRLRQALLDGSHPPASLGRHLLGCARRGQVNVFRLHAIPGYTAAKHEAYRGTLLGLQRSGLLRVEEFGWAVPLGTSTDVDRLDGQGRRQGRLLRRMRDFAAMRRGCRHAELLSYFGEHAAWKSCGACDLCG